MKNDDAPATSDDDHTPYDHDHTTNWRGEDDFASWRYLLDLYISLCHFPSSSLHQIWQVSFKFCVLCLVKILLSMPNLLVLILPTRLNQQNDLLHQYQHQRHQHQHQRHHQQVSLFYAKYCSWYNGKFMRWKKVL